MKDTLLHNWSFLRIIRLALGGFIAYDGFRTHEFLIMTMGLVFMGLAVMNLGCCGAQGCGIPAKSNSSKATLVLSDEPQEVDYEEVK